MAVWSTTTKVEISKNKRFDSEFFHPNYLASEEMVVSSGTIKNLGELGHFLIGPFGSAFHVSNYDPSSEYRYIRGKDVKPFALLEDDNVYMPEKDYKRLAKYAVISDDLLISVVGTLGNVAIVPENTKGIFSCKSTVFRNSAVDPYYLLAYFNCKYGRDCLLRRQRGAVQTGLNKDDLETTPVPLFTLEEHELIGNIIRKSLELSNKAKVLYTQAQKLLEKEMKLSYLISEKTRRYEAQLSEAVTSNRIDAEFFNPQYIKLSSYLHKYGSIPLGSLFYITRGKCADTADYSRDKGIPFIRIKELSLTKSLDKKECINIPYSSFATSFPTVDFGDYILAVIGATIGKINLIENDFIGAVFSNNTARLRPKNLIKYPHALELIMRSYVIQGQIKQRMAKTAQEKIADDELRKILIPIIPDEVANTLDVLVVESKQAMVESQGLLEQAKKRVEGLIEGVI